MSPIVPDTSAAATDKINYVVTDSTGLRSVSTRTVIIQASSLAADTAHATSFVHAVSAGN